MQEFDVISGLLSDAHREISRLEKWSGSIASGDEKWMDMPTPSKQRIYDDLVMIRRLTLDIEKKVRGR